MSTNETIKKKFYFVTNDVIYETSNYNDKDGCGKCPSHNDDGTIKTDAELASIFPFIKLTYTYKEKDGSESEENDKYLWLQDFIVDGDKYKGEKFECTAKLHDNASTFLERYINQIKNEAYKEIKNGILPQSLKNRFPKYFTNVTYTDFIDGKDVVIKNTSLKDTDRIFSDTNIGKLYEETAKQEAKIAANKILDKNGQQVDTLTLTVKSV